MDEHHNIYVKTYPLTVILCERVCVCVCVLVCTNLAASVDVEQTHPTSQLLGILDAVPQNTGGEIEGALIRLHRQKHTNTFNSLPRGKV